MNDINKEKEIIEPFRVFVRVRPIINQDEIISQNYLSRLDNQTLVLNQSSTLKYFGISREDRQMKFDYVFMENDENHTVYDKALSPSLQNVIKGYNTTALCYGMTGAGKTFTMFGNGLTKIENCGLIYQAVKELFDIIYKLNSNETQVGIKISFIEIYNETIKDLIGTNDQLQILEDQQKGILIPGIEERTIRNLQQLNDIIILGQQRRTFASTYNNIVSSRSHAIVQITVTTVKNSQKEIIEGKLTLVDLAGSERTQSYGSSQNSSANQSPQRRQLEGQNINRSLLALGQCITLLQQQNGSTQYIPYRNSKLTRLLKQSLGGNTLTMFIACISKSKYQTEETENTLRYALQAKKLKSHLRQQSVIY